MTPFTVFLVLASLMGVAYMIFGALVFILGFLWN